MASGRHTFAQNSHDVKKRGHSSDGFGFARFVSKPLNLKPATVPESTRGNQYAENFATYEHVISIGFYTENLPDPYG